MSITIVNNYLVIPKIELGKLPNGSVFSLFVAEEALMYMKVESCAGDLNILPHWVGAVNLIDGDVTSFNKSEKVYLHTGSMNLYLNMNPEEFVAGCTIPENELKQESMDDANNTGMPFSLNFGKEENDGEKEELE